MQHTLLAPSPDFRYVGLSPGPALGPRVAASLFLAGGGVGAGLMREIGLPQAALAACLAATGVALLWRRAGARLRVSSSATPFALVPWGVLVDHEQEPRVLRWAAVRSLNVHTFYGRDGATSSTLFSVVTLQTERDSLVGRAAGAVSLERLLVHMEAYAREQERRVALDLDGESAGGGLLEPQVDRLLAAALDVIHRAPASHRLGLEASYRMTGARPGEHTPDSLRAMLRDRADHELDRRPLAAILAAELRLTELLPDLVPLVQSPHPIVAGVAKAAALRLGATHTKVGHIDEIAPFLAADDVESLSAFAASPPIARAPRAEVELRA
ncbi:MAG TPA: hypothetical protein VLM85_26505 [Polyangiaceae bacterium]|nr:hypothetical protein [Polyangiaceae bacterium]